MIGTDQPLDLVADAAGQRRELRCEAHGALHQGGFEDRDKVGRDVANIPVVAAAAPIIGPGSAAAPGR